jgi:ribosomal protein S18 acetylase RimI-like enzyme
MKFGISEIKGKKNMLDSFSLLRQLTPELSQKEMKFCLELMLPMGYRMFGVYDGKKLVGCTGIWTGAKFYCGKFMEIDNFILDNKYRSKGIGKLLTDYIEKLAKKEKCKVVMLDAYTTNHASHKFYLREGFIIKGFHFIKYL